MGDEKDFHAMTDEERRHFLRRCEDKKLFKEAVKEAAKEWLQDQFAAFGKWSAIGIASATFFLVVKILVTTNVWPKIGG